MAYPYRRRGSSLWTIYYYDKAKGKNVSVHRKDTPLELQECQTQEEAQDWVDRWAERHGVKVHRALRYRLRNNDELKVLWDDFQGYWQTLREVEDTTLRDRTEDFERYALPYFVEKLGLKNVRMWNKHVLDFAVWLKNDTKLKDPISQKKVMWMLKRFGEYLVSKEVLDHAWVVLIPTKNKRRTTPLTTRVTPEQALSIAKSFLPEKPLFALSLLLGYFASLGPAEVYGLEKIDFLTGDRALFYSKTYEGFKRHEKDNFKDHALGSRLAISIERQVVESTVEKFPKNDYRKAVVTVWHPDGAKMIAALLEALPDGRLFHYSRSHLDKLQKENVKKKLKTTGHDLRRASALYLGRTVRLPLELLQRHLRHSQLSTTELYIREPEQEEVKKDVATQNFADVV